MFKTIGEMVQEEDIDALTIIPGSLCMECGESGETRMMTTKIPFFREIIVCSFVCDSCGSENNEVTFGGEIQEKGVRFTLLVKDKKDLNRSVIKADAATMRIPSLDFEIPARSQKGGITTVEGILSRAAENLGMYQKERMVDNPEVGLVVAKVISSLTDLALGESPPFEMVVDDPSGNSFVENLCAPSPDPQLSVKHYSRTAQQDLAIGLQPSAEGRAALEEELRTGIKSSSSEAKTEEGQIFEGVGEMLKLFGTDEAGHFGSEELSTSLGRREIIRIPTHCPHCLDTEGESLTCFADIPHFKEVIIMAFDCTKCGYRSNEVKAGGGVPARGQTFTLTVQGPEDLCRDVLKSSSADVVIPELEFEASQGSTGGVFTTVEGLLSKVHKAMQDSTPYMLGDSQQDSDRKSQFKAFNDKFVSFIEGGSFPFTLQLRDPLANSFIGPRIGESPQDDPLLAVEDYARSWEEDEEYGLHDIDTGDPSPSTGATAANPNRALTHKRWGADHPHEFAKVLVTPPRICKGTSNCPLILLFCGVFSNLKVCALFSRQGCKRQTLEPRPLILLF